MGAQRQTRLDIVGGSSARRAGRELIHGFRVHRVGVEISGSVDQRTWYEFGKLLRQVEYARDWVIADWLAFGEHKYGDKIYQLAARLLGKSARTWEDYAYIARNVRLSERSEILPALVHRPVARFRDDASLQHKLLAIAEQHSLSKATFEAVIELYLEGKSYDHLLPARITPIERARLRADKERDRVLERAQRHGGAEWVKYAREQVRGWQRVLEKLEEQKA
jgi:hypothetical protein